MARRPPAVFDRLAAWSGNIPLRTKITGVTVLILTLGLLVSGIGTTSLLRPQLVAQVDNRLLQTAQSTEAINDLAKNSQTESSTDSSSMAQEYYVAYFAADGTLLHTNGEVDGEKPEIPASIDITYAMQNAMTIRTLPQADGLATWHSVIAVGTIKDTNEQVTVLIADSLASVNSVMGQYVAIYLSFGLAVVLVGALMTRLLLDGAFGPLRRVETTAARIAEGDFSQRLPDENPATEVGHLNHSLNTMLQNIDRAFDDRARTIDQMRRFVGDASHELRTPLVSVRGYAELYRMGALQNDEQVAQAMGRIEAEAIRMGVLVEDLLELARLDETKPLTLAPVDLLPLAVDAAMDTRAAHPDRVVHVLNTTPTEPVAEPIDEAPAAERPDEAGGTGPIRITGAFARLRRRPRSTSGSASEQPATSSTALPGTPSAAGLAAALDITEQGDEHHASPVVAAEQNKLRQVVTNLLGNAIRYTEPGSPLEIRVSADPTARLAVLEVIDHGEGIPEQIRGKIFQRFWRADSSRTRETGGSGLGLAIVSSIIDAHKGRVAVLDTPGGGATFRVELPLLRIDRAD